MEMIAFDSHRRYTLSSVADGSGRIQGEARIPHVRGAVVAFLRGFTPGAPVAVETMGNWYWIVDEIEAAGMRPCLVHARKAKLMLGCVNKTDRLDARGLNRLQQAGTLPTVWIPPGPLRDQREVLRARMELVHQRTQLKNRVSAILAKYAVDITEVRDAFGKRGRTLMHQRLELLPPHTRFTTIHLLEQVDALATQIRALEEHIEQIVEQTPAVGLLRTEPGVGRILSVVIAWEVGDVARFPGPDRLAAYAGTTPRVHASGGKVHYGAVRADVNRYLKWAFAEAANTVALYRARWPQRHVVQLYERIRRRKGHGTAVGAVSRHLAEATYWILTKQQPYQEPTLRGGSPTEA